MKVVAITIGVLLWGGLICFIVQPRVATWRNKRKLRAAGKLVKLNSRRKND